MLNRNNSQDWRRWCLAGISFQLGFLVGPAINHLAVVDPQILIQAIAYTSAAFVSFTALAMFSTRRSYLFLGAIIVTLMQALALYRLFSWLFGYNSGFSLGYLMVGLFTACLYIIYDTQIIIERAERGDKDEIAHAFTLFLDVFDLFMKILRILLELQKKEEENNRRKRRD